MKKMKENFKKHWKLSLVLFALLLGVAGATTWFVIGNGMKKEQTVSVAYTAYVQNEQGQSLEKVYVMLCAEDGTEITWLPYVTNTSGKVQFVEGIEEGCYVKVVGVPVGYKLDESVKYEFDSFGNVKITLTEDDSVYIAQIGDTKFMSFASALGVANASSEDVTIELMADVVMNTGTIKNSYGKNITVKGNGYAITAEGGNNALLINQENGVVAFEDVNFVHKNTGALFQVNGLTTLSLTDATIDATGGSAYNYALINTMAVDGTTTLNMTRVDVKMAVQTPAKADQAGIIRTGNTSGTKTVDMNLVDCNFDTEGATGRQCIVVMKNTVANIKATNCSFKSGDSPAIWGQEQSKMQYLVMNNSKAVSTVSPHTETPIKGYAAMIGNTYYLTFTHAAEVANTAKKDVTIKAAADTTIKTCTINNANGKTITVDGNGKTITTSGGNNAFVVGNNVTFKNMKINHKNTGSAIHVTKSGYIKATDVVINATEGKTYNYSLINTLATGKEKTTLDFTRVNAVMAVESKGDANASVIRTGNASQKDSNGKVTQDNSKVVDIILTDCNFDTTKATGRTGITITKDATTKVDLKNTTIKTMDTYAIRSNEQDVNWDNADTVLTSLDKTYQEYPVEYYLAKIGDVFYTFAGALDVANAAKNDTTINLLANYTIKSAAINNENGKNVTLNGNGKTITTSDKANAFLVGNKVALKNMTINHKTKGSAIHVVDIGTIDVSNVTINATEGKAYDYALINILVNAEGVKERAAAGEVTTLNMSDVDVTMSVAGRGEGNNAIIRTGNTDKKTVKINLNNCNLNTEKATGRSGILVMKNTNATIALTNTNIKTLDSPAVQLKDTGNHQTMTMNNCTFDSLTEECKQQPVVGYDAQVGNVAYRAFTQALSSAKNGETVEVLQNVSTGWVNVINSCTIDGNDYTITFNEGDASDKISLVMKEKATDVTIKNAKLVHKRRGMLVRADIPMNFTMENVKIDATKAEVSNEYALFNLMGKNGTTNLVWKNVTVDMDATEAGKDGNAAIIRTGNADDKVVNITLKDCALDATDATGRTGIAVMNKTNANINLENTTIKTGNVPAIKANEGSKGQATIPTSAELICGKKVDEHTGYAIQVGDTWYVKYDETLLDVAKNATEDVTVTLTEDMTINLAGLKNVNNKTITINTNGNCLTTTGTKDDTVVISSEAQATIDEETFYASLETVVKQANVASEDVKIELLDASEVNLTDVNNTKGNTITIDTNGKRLSTTGTLWSNVSVVSQTKYVSGTENLYVTLTEALKEAKEATEDVTITIMADVTVKEVTAVNNDNGNTITIDGNTHIVSTTCNNAIKVSEANVEFKNMTITHTASQAAIAVWGEANVSLTDVIMNATLSEGYQYGLINLLGTNKVILNLTNVDVNMNVTTKDTMDNAHAIIRTGDYNKAKDVEINIKDCNLDASDSGYVRCILIMQQTSATVKIEDSVLTSNNVHPIFDRSSGKSIITKSKAALAIKEVDEVACIGTEFYDSFELAYEAAEAGDTIELLDDITISSQFVIDKAIIIDGNMHKVTTNVKDAFKVSKVDVAFKNMNIEHTEANAAIIIWGAANVSMTDVVIRANSTSYENGLIILRGTAKIDLTLKNVDVTMDVTTKDDKDNIHAILRVGNWNEVNDVVVNMEDCNFNAGTSDNVRCVLVMNKSKADVTITNSTLTSKNVDPILNRCTTGTTTITQSSNGAGMATMSLEEEPKTKQLILNVPTRLYDALVDWIKQFARANDWDLDL